MDLLPLRQLQLRWTPITETELLDAVAVGLLEETHYLELKGQLDSGSGGNKELARDLAQFAIDSGTLVIGVAEVNVPTRLAFVAVWSWAQGAGQLGPTATQWSSVSKQHQDSRRKRSNPCRGG